MENKNFLYISSELPPYLVNKGISNFSMQLLKKVQERKNIIRVFMPCYGFINQRKYNFHEVIRLSGSNLVINDIRRLLIIKVATCTDIKSQVYFIDNEEYFNRKYQFEDENSKLFEDNDERSMFYVKGIIETIKKLNWKPDIIQLDSWFSFIFALYRKKIFNNDAILENSKLIVTFSNDDIFDGTLSKDISDKLIMDGINESDIDILKNSNYEALFSMALSNADGVVNLSKNPIKFANKLIKKSNLPVMNFSDNDDIDMDFYSNILK